jgi:ABC-type nitrate/sulfonate/bicarbonate transport system ATPase subunit
MQAHPGAIIAEVPVPLQRPRYLEMRADPTFVALRARVLDLLHHRVRKMEGMADAENRLRHA